MTGWRLLVRAFLQSINQITKLNRAIHKKVSSWLNIIGLSTQNNFGSSLNWHQHHYSQRFMPKILFCAVYTFDRSSLQRSTFKVSCDMLVNNSLITTWLWLQLNKNLMLVLLQRKQLKLLLWYFCLQIHPSLLCFLSIIPQESWATVSLG